MTRARLWLGLPLGVVRAAVVVRVLDEWWSWLPAGAIEDLRTDLGITYTQAGWLLALLTLGGLVGGPFSALADRGYRRTLAVGGAVMLACGLAVYAAAAPFWAMALASAAMGAASDLMIRPLETSLAELAGDRLDRMLGRQHLLTWGGDLIGPAVLAFGAATALGWQGAFALTAGVMLAFAAMLALTEFPVPGGGGGDDEGDGEGEGDESLWRAALGLMRRREVLLLVVAEVLITPLDEAFLGFAVARAAVRDSADVAQALAVGIFVGGLAGSAMVSRWGLTPRVRRVGPPALVGGAAAAAMGPGLWAEGVALVAMGLGTAVVWAALHHRMLTAVPGRSATVSTVVGTLSTPGLVLPVAIGAIADATSLTVGLVMTAALAIPLVAVHASLQRFPCR